MIKDTDYAVEHDNNVTPGIGKVTVTGKDNYKGSKSITYNIKKAPAQVTAPTAKTLTCGNGTQDLIVEGASTTGVIKYRVNSNKDWSENIPTASTAGTYTVYYKSFGDSNHLDSDEMSITVTFPAHESMSSADNKAATCTATGWKDKTECKNCHTVLSAGSSVPATGHTSANGGTSGVHTKCSTCGTTLSASHTYNVKSGVQYTAATCITAQKLYYKCSCGYNPQSASYVYDGTASLGHTGDNTGSTITAATCTTDGSRYKKCTRCGANYGSVTLSALGHDYSVKDNKKAAFHMSDCETIYYYKCSRCNVYSKDTYRATVHMNVYTNYSHMCSACHVGHITSYGCTFCNATWWSPCDKCGK